MAEAHDPRPRAADLEGFRESGYLVVRGLAPPALCERMRACALEALDPLIGPAEYEADVRYPGSPESRLAEGGDTPRRLLAACARDRAFREWATSPALGRWLGALLGTGAVRLAQSHHNCVMTKHPGHSSATLWHQDIRYWSFDRPELVTAWLALGRERAENGALAIIPGSHRLGLDRGRLDAALFLRPELPENRELIAGARTVELDAGDVVLFHCNAFHAAGRNDTGAVKLSVVFTYHAADNRPIPGTKSASYPSIPMRVSGG